MTELDDPKHNRNEDFPWEPRYQLTEPQTKVKPKKLLCHVKTETNEAKLRMTMNPTKAVRAVL